MRFSKAGVAILELTPVLERNFLLSPLLPNACIRNLVF